MKSQRLFRGPFLWILVLLVALYATISLVSSASAPRDLTFTEFLAEARAGNVAEATIGNRSASITGELKAEGGGDPEPFTTAFTPEIHDEILAPLIADGTIEKQTSDPEQGSALLNFLFQMLPFALIFLLFFFLMQQMQGGGGRVMQFGKAKAKLVNKDSPKVTFTDVAGVDEAIEELREIKEFLENPSKFQAMGAKIPKGVLLYGPPGTGKTLLARAVAGEAGVPFFSISGSDFVEMFVGVGASVTGDTPVLIKDERGTRLVPIGEYVDAVYEAADEDGDDVVVFVDGAQTLGFRPGGTGFRGDLIPFGGSRWSNIQGVYRHKVDEIFEISYLGGTIRTTGDHSVFVRGHGGIKAVEARDLKPGDILVPLPTHDREALRQEVADKLRVAVGAGGPAPERNWIDGESESDDPVIREVRRVPYDGYVYDLTGCDHEAFFGGEQPVLLHNSRVRDLFEQAKANAPAIIFVDEIDAVGRHRGAGLGGGHDEREQTLNQLLVEMDGFDARVGVILIAATNRPDILDPALLRPGRFDRQIVVDRPDLVGREAILQVHTRGKPLSDEINLNVLARQTPGFTGADLANMVNEAALLAARFGKKEITMLELEEAIERVIAGPERKTRLMNEKEKKIVAYHEAGHAIVGHALPNADPVHKISIIPRGRALGFTMQLPTEDKYLVARGELIDRLAVMLGGRVAEEIKVGDITTGAGDDIQRATATAKEMVTQYGMSEKLGPMVLGQKDSQPFLGRDFGHTADYSSEVAFQIDLEIRGLIDEAHDEALEILVENDEVLESLANRLLEVETVDGKELGEIFAAIKQRPSRAITAPHGKSSSAILKALRRNGDGTNGTSGNGAKRARKTPTPRARPKKT